MSGDAPHHVIRWNVEIWTRFGHTSFYLMIRFTCHQLTKPPPGCTAHFNVVEVWLHSSYIIVICQLTVAPAVFYHGTT